jgi:membrane protein
MTDRKENFPPWLTVLLHWKPVSILVSVSKKIVIPGFDRTPLYEVAEFFIRGLYGGYITSRAAAVSFSFFLAIFPSLIFLFTIIPFIPIADFQQILMEIIRDFLPKETFETVRETIEGVVIRPHSGLLSLGFILTMYFSTNGIHSLIEAFNHSYHAMETRSWLKQRLVSFLLVIILSILLIIAIGMMTFGSAIIRLILPEAILTSSIFLVLLWLLKWILILMVLFLAISSMYYFAPASRHRFRFISAGATLATILIIVTTMGFNFYVGNFSKYNVIYGSIGTLLIILLWIYFNAISLIIGFELNASILKAGTQQKMESR